MENNILEMYAANKSLEEIMERLGLTKREVINIIYGSKTNSK